VGGSPQPIATALRLLRPAAAWFLVSDGKAGESSRSQVEEPEIDYDRHANLRGPGLKFAEGCPAGIRIIPMPADDPDGAYKICRSQLTEARRGFPDHRLIADYTGGTKSMTGALLMAAFAEKGFEVQFMAGERPDLVQVKPGSEKPRRMVPDFIVAERRFADAEQAIAAFDYEAARLLLARLRQDLSNMRSQPSKPWRRRLDRAVAWSALMAEWDAFSHREAASRAQKDAALLEPMLRASSHLQPLLALGSGQKGKPDFLICADLWLNALRRGERGRYDDAVARLYRLAEATAQAHLWRRYGLRSRLPPSELPEGMRSSVEIREDEKDGNPYALLGLDKTVQFLRHRDPEDPFAVAYGPGVKDRPAWLSMRNNSILAHGFSCVTRGEWSAARDWTQTNIVPFFGKPFEQLPCKIPCEKGRTPG
jgi:CRISPR-associated protein (TIGR02710 family)